jgi:hypothetical protein
MLAQPIPAPLHGGSVDALFTVLNVPDEEGRVLIRGYLLGMLHPTGPYPGLALYGEQGSAKSSAAVFLRSVIDPTSAPKTGKPRNDETVFLQAHANWVPAFDNLGAIPDWLADALCGVSTGMAYNKRTLYDDTGLTVINVMRPFILTSITDAVTQSDLLNRLLVVRCPAIPKEHRLTEAELAKRFARAHPYILGGLLDATVEALKGYKTAQVGDLPRMADIARWVQAGEEALGQKPGTFVSVYTANEVDSYEAVLNANLVAQAVIRLMAEESQWEDTPTELYRVLSHLVAEGPYDKTPFGWPTNAKTMSDKLNAAVPALREREGIDVRRGSPGHERVIRLLKLELEDGSKSGPAPHILNMEASGASALWSRSDATDAQIPTLSSLGSKVEEEEEERKEKARAAASDASVEQGEKQGKAAWPSDADYEAALAFLREPPEF